MSWRSGEQLFGEIWPLLQVRIPARARRQELLRELLALFLKWDIDAANVADLHAEVREALAILGVAAEAPSSGDDDVAGCIRHLSSRVEKQRVDAAQALDFFVHQADDPDRAAGVALRALVNALRDESVPVRRAVANSIAELLGDGFALPGEVRKKLAARASDDDEVVRKRIAAAMKHLEKSSSRAAGHASRASKKRRGP